MIFGIQTTSANPRHSSNPEHQKTLAACPEWMNPTECVDPVQSSLQLPEKQKKNQALAVVVRVAARACNVFKSKRVFKNEISRLLRPISTGQRKVDARSSLSHLWRSITTT
jgi:hypothetical protein